MAFLLLEHLHPKMFVHIPDSYVRAVFDLPTSCSFKKKMSANIREITAAKGGAGFKNTFFHILTLLQ